VVPDRVCTVYLGIRCSSAFSVSRRIGAADVPCAADFLIRVYMVLARGF
jgi:hypothetical protein